MRLGLFAWTLVLGALGCATTTPISDGSGAGGSTSSSKIDTSADTGGAGGGGTTCGDLVCDRFETCVGCPEDCGECGPACGDGVCDATSEDCASCESDCGACSVCGDGTCDAATEDCKTCYEDCGICACMPDTFEPNNSSPSATGVTSGVDYCDLSVCTGDVDWLEFNVSNGFTAKATFKEGQGDLDLEIYSAQTFNFVSGSYSADDDESVTLTGLSPGAYWARIYGKGGAVNPDYCFRVDAN